MNYKSPKRAEYLRLYRLENKESISKRTSDNLKFYKKQILDHYGWKCNCCSETTPQFLTIDHVENDGFKDKDKSGRRINGATLYKKIIRENFGARYQILCMNCNHGKRMNLGICPHKII